MASGFRANGSRGTSSSATMDISASVTVEQGPLRKAVDDINSAIGEGLHNAIREALHKAAAEVRHELSLAERTRVIRATAGQHLMGAGLSAGTTVTFQAPMDANVAGAMSKFKVRVPAPLTDEARDRHLYKQERLRAELEREIRRADRLRVPETAMASNYYNALDAIRHHRSVLDPAHAVVSATAANTAHAAARDALQALKAQVGGYRDDNAQQTADADLMGWRRQSTAMSASDTMEAALRAGAAIDPGLIAHSQPTSRADIQRSNYYNRKTRGVVRQTLQGRGTGRTLTTDWDLFEQQVQRAGMSPGAYSGAYDAVLAGVTDPTNPDAVGSARDALRRAKAQFAADKASASGGAVVHPWHQTAAQQKADAAAYQRALAIAQTPTLDLTRQFAIEDALKAQDVAAAAAAADARMRERADKRWIAQDRARRARTDAMVGTARVAADTAGRLAGAYAEYSQLAAGAAPGVGMSAARLGQVSDLLGVTARSPKLLRLQEEALTDLRDATRSVKRAAAKDEADAQSGVAQGVRALARFGMRGSLATVANMGGSYISGGTEGLASGAISGVGAVGNAAMTYGLTTGNIPVALAGTVVSGVSSLFGAANERGAAKRRAGLSAAEALEQQTRAFSTTDNTVVTQHPAATAYNAWADTLYEYARVGRAGASPELRAAVDAISAATPGGRPMYQMGAEELRSIASRMRSGAARIPTRDQSLSRAALFQSITSQLAQPAYGMTTQQAMAFTGGYMGAARFNPFMAIARRELRSDIVSGAMSGLGGDQVAQARYLSMRGVLPGVGRRQYDRGPWGDVQRMLERSGRASTVGYALTGGAYGALGVAQSFGRYGGAANDFVNFAMGLGEQSLARTGGALNINSLLGTAASLGRSGQSLEGVQNYMQRSMSSAERARGFFTAPMEDLEYTMRIAMAAREGGDPATMGQRAAGLASASVAKAIAKLGPTVSRLWTASGGLDPNVGADFSDMGTPAAAAIQNNPWSYASSLSAKGRELMFSPSREAANKLAATAKKLDEVSAMLAEGAQALLGAGDDTRPSWMK